MVYNCIRIGNMIVNNSRGSSINRVRVKGIATSSATRQFTFNGRVDKQMNECNMQFLENLTSTVQDLKM
ncbi:hypothetical protein CR513_43375, partial [Mucuna pruriens]